MRKWIGLMLACAVALPAFTAESLSFIKVPQGARSAALGGAYGMVPGSAETLWYNPAGAAGLRGGELGFSHLAWIGDTANEFLSGAWGNGKLGLGGYVQYAGTSDITRDAFGNEGSQFGVSAMTVGLAGGYQMGKVRVGAGAKMLQQSVAGSSASGFAGDLGLQADLWQDKLVASISLLNLGSAPEPGSLSDPVSAPMNVRGGLGLVGFNGFTVLAEYRQWIASQQGSMAVGAEYALRAGQADLAGRVGYESGLSEGETAAGLTAGLGLGFGAITLDYSFQALGDLGSAHRATLGWRFGKSTAAAPVKKPAPLSNAVTGGKKPLSLKAQFDKAKADYKAGRFAAARDGLQPLVNAKPKSATLHYYLGMTYWRLKDKARAIRHLDRAVALDPSMTKVKAWLKKVR